MPDKQEGNLDGAQKEQVAAQPTPTPTPTVEPAAKPVAPQGQSNGLAIASMVLGIVALLGGLLPFWGFCLGIVAIILGIVGLKKRIMKGMSITGIVTGGVAVLWSVFVTFAFIALLLTGAAAGNEAAKEANKIDAESQSLINSKKDFAAGEKAKFGENLEVTVNKVTRNYSTGNQYQAPAEGKELIVLNVSVKNVAKESTEYVSSSLFSVNENGVAITPSYVTVEPDLGYGDLSPGATKTGNIVYEVTKGAAGLKLQYSVTTYNFEDGSKKLYYTLAF